MRSRETVRAGAGTERILLAAGCICLLLSALPLRQTVWFLLSAAAHELGHIAVMRICGMPLCGIVSRAGGAVLVWKSESVPFWKEALCAAAGPAVNAVLALLLYRADRLGFAVNVLLAVYNLLPLRGNDGAVILASVCAAAGSAIGAVRILDRIGALLLAVLLMAGAWLFWYGALHDAQGVTMGYGALFFCLFARMTDAVRE